MSSFFFCLGGLSILILGKYYYQLLSFNKIINSFFEIQFWHFFKVLVCRLTYRFEIAGSLIVCHPRDNQGAKNLLSQKLRHQVAFRWLGKELLKPRYRGSPLSTNSLSTISGIVGCQIVLNSSRKSLIYRGSPDSTNFAHPGNCTIEEIVSDLSKTDQTWSNWIPRLYKNDMY